MSYKNAISREDPNAIEKLTVKLGECERLQDVMKELNHTGQTEVTATSKVHSKTLCQYGQVRDIMMTATE